MFVRWQERRRQGAKYTKYDKRRTDTQLRAVLVESVRIDGKPTQRHVAYLGVIDAGRTGEVLTRIWFWDAVTDRLDRLGNRLPGEVRQRIEAAMAKRVPRPTPDERMASARDRAEAFGWEDLSDHERAVLKDEAGQWEGKDSRLVAELKALTGGKALRRCSFCGKSEKEAHTLVDGGGVVFICDECVEAAAKLVAERKATPA